MGGVFCAVAVAAECGVELVDVIDCAGVGQVFVNYGVNVCFGGGAVGCFGDGVCIEVADKKVSEFELSFVFAAGGDEEVLGICGAHAEVSTGAKKPAVVVKSACGVEHIVCGLLVERGIWGHGK